MLHVWYCTIPIALIATTNFWNAAATEASSASAVSSTKQSVEQLLLLHRQRRFLQFDKGSVIMVQTNINKAILPERSRGLNEIAEYTLTYDLPTRDTVRMLHLPTGNFQAKTKQTTLATTRTTPASHIAAENVVWPLSSTAAEWQWPPTAAAWQSRWDWPRLAMQNQQEQFHRQFVKLQRKNRTHCHKRHIYGHQKKQQNLQCAVRKKRHSDNNNNHDNKNNALNNSAHINAAANAAHQANGRRGTPADVRHLQSQPERHSQFNKMATAEHILFDLLTQLAQLHNYPPQYCIMRTLCEFRHLLEPEGHSLFHDLLRILFDAALPATRRHAFYSAAIRHDSLSDCVQYYAAQCHISFLQHFTEAATAGPLHFPK